jgi:hypothetical protein
MLVNAGKNPPSQEFDQLLVGFATPDHDARAVALCNRIPDRDTMCHVLGRKPECTRHPPGPQSFKTYQAYSNNRLAAMFIDLQWRRQEALYHIRVGTIIQQNPARDYSFKDGQHGELS